MGLTVKGVGITTNQQNFANQIIQIGASLNAGSIATGAILVEAIAESGMGDPLYMGWDASNPTYGGILAGAIGTSGGGGNFGPLGTASSSAVTVAEITAAFKGGRGYQGAIGLAKTSSDLLQIAMTNSGSGSQFLSEAGVQNFAAEARAILAAGGGAPIKGGVAGLGSTGTIVNGSSGATYAFQIGGTNNPSEDIWTGINRLAQEVNWYLFSNGEYLYYMDGEELIAQQPAMYLDRVLDAGQIASLTLHYDNTAFQWVSAHRRKAKVQRKTRTVQITSPTEVQLELFCGIDELRAGDVLVLSSFGPANGRWLIGGCRRSVFSPTSSLTLVPPLSPLSELAVAGTTGRSGSSSSGTGSSSGKGSSGKAAPATTGGYVNPLGKITGLTGGRIDMGADYSGSGPVLAIGDGKIISISNSGWPGGAFIEIQLSGGAYAGKFWYCAENITPSVQPQQVVKAGDQIGTLINAYPNCELGWGIGTGGTTLAASLGQAGINSGHANCAAGASADRFMRSLGAPACSAQGFPLAGTMPAGYP
jgi:hypothetical protein